jgi:tetratricopeptide (TPR) repeat protein
MGRHNFTRSRLVIAFIVLFSGQASAADTNAIDPPAETTSQQVNRLMKEFTYSVKVENYPSALITVNQVVMLLADKGRSKNQAMALHNLARVQQLLGMHLKSEQSYKQSIHIIESLEGAFTSELLDLHSDLGTLYYASSDFDLAIESFRKAQHITHRNDGVYSLEQLEFVDSITMLNIKTGRVEDADQQQRFYYSINVRNYGEDDPRMLPAMNKMADWFKASGQFNEAMRTYEKALAVIDKFNLGDTEKLEPLRGLSTVIYLKGSCCSDDPLGQALHIVMTDPGSDHVDELDALIHLADMHMIRKKREVAKKYYQDAWNRLGAENPLTHEIFDAPELLGVSRVEDVHKAYYLTVEGRSASNRTIIRVATSNENSYNVGYSPKRKEPATSVIGEPLSLCHSQALALARTSDTEDLAQYLVDINFTVTSEGSVRNVSLLDSNAPRKLQKYVTNTLRQSRYRPTFREGEAVETKNIKLRQTFARNNDNRAPEPQFRRTSVDGKRAASLGCQLLATII